MFRLIFYSIILSLISENASAVVSMFFPEKKTLVLGLVMNISASYSPIVFLVTVNSKTFKRWNWKMLVESCDQALNICCHIRYCCGVFIFF
ncbi:hypothetical protein VIGAN_08107600 [Vigna angularis var. angularis]|uniref:WAT1-related protein n=1 Tax=Vigna angularis var. angularis TaxID=157739 RepID=A0A0S3SNR9_PHAAN|nr:hypothetical protein VIGAN_08107600 [Vigna angularis var. angularis]